MENIENYLNYKTFKSRSELMAETKLSDRDLRREIEHLKQRMPVIYGSNHTGYRLAIPIEESNIEEIKKEFPEMKHCVNDIDSRTAALNKYKGIYMDWLIQAMVKINAATVEANNE